MMESMMNKTYTELSKLQTFEERFKYLAEGGIVGGQTFGGSRFLNQDFYHSKEWKKIRDLVIIRDRGMDLGVDGYPIHGRVIIHHMVPIKKEDIMFQTPFLVDPEYMISMSYQTHNAIHYGSFESIPKDYIPRTPNDTCPWR